MRAARAVANRFQDRPQTSGLHSREAIEGEISQSCRHGDVAVGQVNGLAVTGLDRAPRLPDVPNFA
jgi:hypothetical protein